MTTAYLNGTFLPLAQAKISALDRGFLFGDGVYEVIPCYGGKFFRLQEHLRRLNRSLRAIQLTPPHDPSAWEAILQQLVAYNEGEHQKVYLQITRGAADTRNHSFSQAAPLTPTVFAFSTPLKTPSMEALQKGGRAITLPDSRWLHCHIKSINLLPNILDHETAVSQGHEEALLLRDGLALEGASSNLFIVHNQTVITPPLSNAILGGVTRDLVLELAQRHGIATAEQPIPQEQLFTATEVWVTSSTREILPIVQVNDRVIGSGVPGLIWQKMIAYYQQFKNQYTQEKMMRPPVQGVK